MTTTLVPQRPADPAGSGPSAPAVEPPAPGPLRRWADRTGRPVWSVPARAAVFLLAAVLYCWDLGVNGLGNTFYTAAVQSGTESWKAAFFGSLDRASFITVDKPPAALWLQELSVKVFGLSTASVLLPEALCGVASVMVLYRLVRRWAGEGAAVLASLGFALTPAAALMFRYNNPDALMTLLLLLGAWALWSALENARTSRLVLAGALVGTAFLTKTLEAFIVLPVFVGVYLVAGPPRLGRRLGQLAAFGASTFVASAWWVAAVELWPASARPYLGGSTDNSELNLIFGYNGLSRIFGTGGTGGAGAGAGFGGEPGWLRMFNSVVGGEISWLLPMALAGLAVGLWVTRRRPRADRARAGWLLWGGWTLAFGLVFSKAQGIFHPYYTVVMAPGVAALAAAGGMALWRLGRSDRRWAPVLPAAVLLSAGWAAVLLHRVPGYDTWLVPAVVIGGLAAAALLTAALLGRSRRPVLGLVAGGVAAATLLAGPAAYSITTVRSAHQGGAVTAGPASLSASGFPGGAGGPGTAGGPGGSGGPGPTGSSGFGARPSGTGAPAGGGFPGATARRGSSSTTAGSRVAPSGSRTGAASPSGSAGGGGGPGGSAGPGGSGGTVNQALLRYLERHQGSARYLLAVSGSNTAAAWILASDRAVMAMGGFGGSDPAPTLAQFKAMVAAGEVHYVLVSGGSGGGPGGPGGRSGTVSSILSWVEAHGTVVSSSAWGGSSSAGTLYVVSASAAR